MTVWGWVLWGALALAQDSPPPGSAEADADAAVAAFKQSFTRPGATEDELVLAVRTLGRTVHAKTLPVLAVLMSEPQTVAIRIAAALVLTGFEKIDGTAAALIKAYQGTEKKLAFRAVRIRIIETLGELRADTAAGLVNAGILDRDPWIARAAAKASGRIRGIASIDPLIRRLQFLESKDGERPAPGGSPVPDPGKEGRGPVDPKGGGGGGDGQQKSERQVLQGPIHEALTSITRQSFSCADSWAKWWAQARRDFKVPR